MSYKSGCADIWVYANWPAHDAVDRAGLRSDTDRLISHELEPVLIKGPSEAKASAECLEGAVDPYWVSKATTLRLAAGHVMEYCQYMAPCYRVALKRPPRNAFLPASSSGSSITTQVVDKFDFGSARAASRSARAPVRETVS